MYRLAIVNIVNGCACNNVLCMLGLGETGGIANPHLDETVLGLINSLGNDCRSKKAAQRAAFFKSELRERILPIQAGYHAADGGCSAWRCS